MKRKHLGRSYLRTNWDALARVRWECGDTLDPVARLAAAPRIRRALGIPEDRQLRYQLSEFRREAVRESLRRWRARRAV